MINLLDSCESRGGETLADALVWKCVNIYMNNGIEIKLIVACDDADGCGIAARLQFPIHSQIALIGAHAQDVRDGNRNARALQRTRKHTIFS